MRRETGLQLRERFITLMYLDDPGMFNPAGGLASQQGGPYRVTLQMPIVEFFGRTAIELAVELVQHTNSGPWREGRRRTVMPGDIFCLGMQPWLFIDRQYARHYPMNIVQVSAHGPLGIVQLPPNSVSRTAHDGCDGACDSEQWSPM